MIWLEYFAFCVAIGLFPPWWYGMWRAAAYLAVTLVMMRGAG